MESLESRMERLTPEQRREVEDFVDFILLKNNIRQVPVSPPTPAILSAPPVLTADPLPSPQQPPVRMQDLIRNDPPSSMTSAEPVPSSVHEIRSDGDDLITRDYVDYGKFEQAPSPATEAVKKVKKKLIARETEDPSRRLLDWVD